VIVVVHDDAVELVDAEDCKRFHVEVRDGSDLAAALEADRAGTLDDDGEHAHIAIGWVRQHAVGTGPAWEQDFAGMLDFARTKGWVDEGSSSILAHVERP
jgi:hypothetical protein